MLTYIASDFPLEEVKNEHTKTLSVNEALKFGYKVPDILLRPSFDRDKPDVILWLDDEKNLGEISITKLCKNNIYDDIYTRKKFVATLEWEYTENRAENFMQYIRFHLLNAEEIEIWRIWLGNGFEDDESKLKKYHIYIEDLISLDLGRVFNKNNFEFPECIVVSRNL